MSKDSMKVEVRDGKLAVEIDPQESIPSVSLKTLAVATSHGNQITAEIHDDQLISAKLNAYIDCLRRSQALALGISLTSTMAA